jgi:hypothetical protein
MSNNPLDAGIPVLTEIIPAPALDDAEAASLTSVADTPASVAAPAAADYPVPVQQTAPAWDEAEWDKLERQVRERVLGQLLERVDVILEQRVRDSLADVLQVAVARLADDIRDGLHHSLRNAVERAVAQEIAILQVSKK